MNKNKIILYIAILLILIVIILIIFNKREKNSSIETNDVVIENVISSDGYYTIYNKETNEIIAENIPKDQILLYEDNPDYNPTGI
mgnify:CR=1 FL=1